MKTILTIFILFSCLISKAQNEKGKTDDLGRIVLNAFVPNQSENLPPAVKNNLENKLSQIASSNGLGGSSLNQRFIITSNVQLITKDITPTAPPMHAYTMDITFYIGDGIDGIKFSSYTLTTKGIGENETKAYISAFKNINTSDPKIKDFVETGKGKIIEYYNSKCDYIIKEAETMASRNEYDAALFKLTGVPEVCSDCYNKCMDASTIIYKKKIDYDCKQKLSQANAIWASNQSWDGAELAGTIISTIEPGSICFKDARALSDKISKRIYEIDKREWNLKVEKEVSIEKDRIKAYRDIGVAYGNGQPKSVVYNVRGWW